MAKHEKKRERGGATPGEREEEGKEEKLPARKRGGRIHGAKPAARPDRRARGGAEPTSEAGKMSKPGYEGHAFPDDEHAKGGDRG